MAERTDHARAIGIWIVAIVAAGFGLYFGREFFVPIAFAIVLSVLLRPIVRWMERRGIGTAASAAIVTLVLVALMAAGAYTLAAPFQNWIRSIPQRLDAAEEKLSRLRAPVKQMADAAAKIQHAAQPTSGPSQGSAPATAAPSPAPAAGGVLGATTKLVGALVEVIVLMYLLLASGDLFVRKLIKLMPAFRDKEVAIRVVDESESVVARYMGVTLLINLGQGLLVGLVLWWLGMPSPLLWGCATVVMEFIPYLGATVMVAALAVIAFATFDNFGQILAAPGSYLVITTIQNNVVSPYAYGSRLKLNPVAVLVSVLLWWFLWGTAGAFVAVPIMATLKVVSDRVEGLKAVGEFLGE